MRVYCFSREYDPLRLLAFFVALFFLSTPCAQAVNSPKQVVAITVQGNHYVESETILSKLGSRVGAPLNRRTISRDVRRLFATGFFSDVRVIGEPKKGGIRLVYVVKENPLVAGLEIHGNDEIETKVLKPRLKIKPGHVLNDAYRRADIRMIRKAYLKKGYYQVTVDIEKHARKDGRVNVVINVHEGEVTRIKRIRFVGNRVFPDAVLLKEVASRRSDFTSWFSDRDVFKRDRLAADAQLIELYYMNHGYLDAKVESTLISLSPDRKWFYLTFSIHEGPQYTVKSVNLQGDMVPDRETLMRAVTIKPGELYSVDKLRESINTVSNVVGDEGYAFANVTPLFHRDIQARTVDLTLDIEKGQEVYIERIEISGNTKSDDEVIRRELRQEEGERYARSKVETSKKRLKRTQLLEDTRISFPKGSAPGLARMKVDVEERKTGSFTFGVGFSQLEKTFITSKIQEKNILGKGLDGRLTGQVGVKTQNFDASLTDPYFLDKDISASVNAFKTQTRLQETVTFKQDDFGGGVGFGIPLTETLTYSIGYQYTETNLLDIPADASLILRSQAGKQQTGELTQSLTWDTRDNTLAPGDGHFESVSVGVAGLGGRNRFLALRASSHMYFPLGSGFILSPSLTGMYIRGYFGKDVPIYRRFSLGGVGSLRGFDNFGVTIRDAATNDILGGNKAITAALNLYFPIPYMQTKGFRGVLFVDAGNVADFTQHLLLADTRVSSGLSIEWLSPIGPVGLTWGFPLRKKADDITKNFEFSLGSVF